jgi:hypothetical protein
MEFVNDGQHIVSGDNQVIPKDTHLLGKQIDNLFPRKRGT